MAAYKSVSVILLVTIVAVHSRFEFTNLKCTSFNKTALEIEKCFLKSVNRTYKYASFKTKIHSFPVTDLTADVQVFKRLNGYKPFLFNYTLDGCKFLKGKRNKVTQFFFDLIAPYSNITHPCPYNHDVYIELPISYVDNILNTVLPVPEGYYLIQSVYYNHGVRNLELKVYVNIY